MITPRKDYAVAESYASTMCAKTKEGMRKVAAEEISSLAGLRRVYANPDRGREAVLRVFHVQNAYWATRFLLRKFNIDNHDSIVGTDFGNWVRHRQAERRAGKPVLNGRTWKTQHDPWRSISRTAFGLEYLKEYPYAPDASDDVKLMELNRYDDEDSPVYGYDVYVQRLGVYVQYKEHSSALPTDPDIENPYEKEESRKSGHRQRYTPQLDTLDNENAIIIFENSHSGSIHDTCIPARGDWESRWRRLPFYLAYESPQYLSTDEVLAIECMKLILQDIFKSIGASWDSLLDKSYTHVSILEDKIYEQPADESRAPELWTNSSQWLKLEKLMNIHVDVVKEMRSHLFELTEDETLENKWLEASPEDFTRLSSLIEEDLVKPTANLADLMYKSVGIRDSRHSLQLGVSMWRLSWITFIFLPLTFIVGFFGMNVDTFANNPSIKWYFVSVVPFMLFVLGLWYLLKHMLKLERQTQYQRGVYERLFQDLATSYPVLWSRAGPRRTLQPASLVARLKWRLIRYWAAPENTILALDGAEGDASADGLSSWSRIKRHLMRKWTAQITLRPMDSDSAAALMLDSASDLELAGAAGPSSPGSGAGIHTELFAVPVTGPRRASLPTNPLTGLGDLLRIPRENSPNAPRRSHARAGSRVRPQSAGSGGDAGSDGEGSRPTSSGRHSGVLVEEEQPDWLRRPSSDEDWGRREEEREEREERRERRGREGRASEHDAPPQEQHMRRASTGSIT